MGHSWYCVRRDRYWVASVGRTSCWRVIGRFVGGFFVKKKVNRGHSVIGPWANGGSRAAYASVYVTDNNYVRGWYLLTCLVGDGYQHL